MQEYMSCFGGLSQVLSHIGHVMRLHCGTIVCGPSVSSQEAEEDQLALSSTASIQELGDDAPVTAVKGILAIHVRDLCKCRYDSWQHLLLSAA